MFFDQIYDDLDFYDAPVICHVHDGLDVYYVSFVQDSQDDCICNVNDGLRYCPCWA
jgi:hypothetical protein